MASTAGCGPPVFGRKISIATRSPTREYSTSKSRTTSSGTAGATGLRGCAKEAVAKSRNSANRMSSHNITSWPLVPDPVTSAGAPAPNGNRSAPPPPPNHPMVKNHRRYPGRGTLPRHRPYRRRLTDSPRQLLIALRLLTRNTQQIPPHATLERGPRHVPWQRAMRRSTAQITLQRVPPSESFQSA